MPWYKAGTVTVTNGSPAVVGVGTTWGNGAITPGDSFSLVDASGAAVSPHYEVLTVTDDTHLTLTANYGGTTAAGAKYALWNLAGEHTTPYLSALVSALVQRCKLVLADAASYLSQTLAAKTAAEEARDDAQTAKTAAEAAVQAAENAKSAAQTSATGAANSATTATTAKNDAVTAKNAAESAQTAAQTSATNAAASATQAANSAAQVPIASLLPAAGQVPKAGADGKIDSGWIKDATTAVKGAVELATPAEVLAGTDNERAVTVKDLDYSYATIDSDRIYEGVDLETKFAAEIAGYSDVWAWIKARITAVNYAGLNIGDYIPFLLGGTETIWAKIAGIDTYYRTGDTEIGHHIDFISKDCMATTYQWNTTNINNGDATNASPWMVSALKASLDGLVTSLPVGLQAVIVHKRMLLESRYASGSTLTDSTSWAWNDMGKLWVPTECEVYGGLVFGTKAYGLGNSVQYPIFANSWKSRQKGAGHNGGRSSWWLASVKSGGSAHCCLVGSGSDPNYTNASNALRVPLCFRIG